MKRILHWLLIAILCILIAPFFFLLLVGARFDNLAVAFFQPICILASIVLLWPTLWRGEKYKALKWPRWSLASLLIAGAILLPIPGSVEVDMPPPRSR